MAELKRYDVGRLKPGTSYAATFPEQQAVDGARIPTLAEVFDLVRRAAADHVRFNIETKLTPTSGSDTPDPETFAAAVPKQVRAAGLAARVTVQSFDWRTLAVMRRIAPEIERVCLTIEGGNGDTLRAAAPAHRRGPRASTSTISTARTPRLVIGRGCAVWSPLFRNLTPQTWRRPDRSDSR